MGRFPGRLPQRSTIRMWSMEETVERRTDSVGEPLSRKMGEVIVRWSGYGMWRQGKSETKRPF